MFYRSFSRTSAMIIAAILVVVNVCPAYADVKTAGKTSTYDEAYYVTTDYYGNIMEGSVVKSYTLNDQSEIRDKGEYDSITNLSDGKAPIKDNNEYVFKFDENDVPDHFYYECETKEPYGNLPWDIAVSYKLNGVTVEAEELMGQQGIIEINVDLTPNEKADEYALNNYTLETTAMFNKDDIDSLEADGAQIQLLGNLKTVIFAALPGEEQHMSIKVGTDKFKFDGITFLLIPATLGQLKEISKLAEDKEKLEKNYRKLSNRLDDTIDMIDDMGNDMSKTADDLNKVSSDAGRLAGTMDPMSEEMEAVRQMLNEGMDTTDLLLQNMVSLRVNLIDLGAVISDLQGDLDDAEDKLVHLNAIRNDLEDASDELEMIENDVLSIDLEEDAPKAYALYGAYVNTPSLKALGFEKALPIILDNQAREQVEAMRPQIKAGITAQAKAQKKQELIASGCSEAEAEAKASYYITVPEVIAGIDKKTNEYIDNKVKEIVDPLVKEYAPKETQLKHLYNLYKTNTASPSDASYDELVIINEQLTSIVEGVSAPESLLSDVNSLIGNVKDYKRLIRDMNELGDVTHEAVVEKGQIILDQIENINQIINAYRPSVDQLLQNAVASAKELTKTTIDTGELLKNLAQGLRNASDHINGQESLHVLKDDVSEIIEDTWEEYTGDKNRMLLMDADATPVSITGSDNPAPESIQIIIRTQEIKSEKSETEDIEDIAEITEDSTSSGTEAGGSANVFTRIGDMFADIWHKITGIFARRDK